MATIPPFNFSGDDRWREIVWVDKQESWMREHPLAMKYMRQHYPEYLARWQASIAHHKLVLGLTDA